MTGNNRFPLKIILPVSFILLSAIIFQGTVWDTPVVIEENDSTSGPVFMESSSNYSVILECDLPDVPPSVPLLRVTKVPVSNETAEVIAKDVFGLKTIIEVRKSPFGLELLCMSRRKVTFRGLNQIYFRFPGDRWVESWNETEVRPVADELLARLDKYWTFPTEVEVVASGSGPNHWSNGGVRSIGVWYDLHVEGIELWGSGAKHSVSVTNGLVVGASLYLPALYSDGELEITTSPEEAVDRVLSGESSQTYLGFQSIHGFIPRSGNATIEEMKLIYYIDVLMEPPQGFLPAVYMIKGTVIGPDPTEEGKIIETEFEEHLLATEKFNQTIQ